MKARGALAASSLWLATSLVPTPGGAQDLMLEVTEASLNTLVGRLGAISDAGIDQPQRLSAPGLFDNCEYFAAVACPDLDAARLGLAGPRITLLRCDKAGGGVILVPTGDPVTWQWWVTDAGFTVGEGAMTFTATVRSRVNGETETVTRTVPAWVDFDHAADRLRIQIGSFTVLVWTDDGFVARVEVDQLYGIAVPIEPKELTVPLPDGGERTITARIAGVSTQYADGRLLISVDAGF